MNKKVFIMTASTGGGHNRAAHALQEEILKFSSDEFNIDVEIIDSFKVVNATIDKIISGGYEKSAKYTPYAYGKIYSISEAKLMSKNDYQGNILATLMARKFKQMIDEKKPDLIIGTHAFPMVALSRLKKESIYNNDECFPKLMTVLTDYTAHSAWIQNEIDYYIAGDEYVKEILIEDGIRPESIFTFGIPVEESFLNNRSRKEVLEELDLDPDKFTVLLMGGSFGAGNIKETLDELVSIDRDFQIIVITGRNKSLKHKIDKKLEFYITDKNIKVLGFCSCMNDILAAIDILVTKPGGLTTTEALIKEVPMIIPYFIPGQEEENLDFFTNCGAALRATNKFSVSVLIKVLIDKPERLSSLKNNIRSIRKLDCSENVAKLAYDIMKDDE